MRRHLRLAQYDEFCRNHLPHRRNKGSPRAFPQLLPSHGHYDHETPSASVQSVIVDNTRNEGAASVTKIPVGGGREAGDTFYIHEPAHLPGRNGPGPGMRGEFAGSEWEPLQSDDTHPLLEPETWTPNTHISSDRSPQREVYLPPRLVSLGQKYGFSNSHSQIGGAGNCSRVNSQGNGAPLIHMAQGLLHSIIWKIGTWLFALSSALCKGSQMDPPPSQDEVLGEACVLVQLALPVSATTVCRLVIFATDAAFVGHLGTTQMAAAALAQVCQSMSFVFIYGTAVALNTLCAQAIGAGNVQLAGLWLQLALFLLAVISCLVILAFLYTQQLLEVFLSEICFDEQTVAESCAPDLWAGSEPVSLAPGCICRLAGVWSERCALYVGPLALFLALRQYLQAQEIVVPTAVISVLTIPLNVLANRVLVHGAFGFEGLGFRGSPFATLFSICFQVVGLVGYCFVYKRFHLATWPGWDIWSALHVSRVGAFLQVALPMSFAMAMDEWVYQLIVLLIGARLGTSAREKAIDIDAQSILFQAWEVLWAIFWGFALALQIRVALFLGNGRARAARIVMVSGRMLVSILVVVCATGMYVLRFSIAKLFNASEEVQKAAADATVLFVGAYIFSVVCLFHCALLNGMGRTSTLALITGFGSWGINLPLIFILAFQQGLGLQGVWYAAIAGELFKGVWVLYLVATTDWQAMAEKALSRSESFEEAWQEDEGALGARLLPLCTFTPPLPLES